jgi:hypothetical protein
MGGRSGRDGRRKWRCLRRGEKGPNELAVLCLVGGGFDRVDVRSGRSMLNAEMTMGGRSKGRKL